MVCHYLKVQIIKYSQYYAHWTILSQFLLLCFMLIRNQMHQMVLREIFSTSTFFWNKVAFIIMVTYYQCQSTFFCCNAPARTSLKKIKNHTGGNSYERWWIWRQGSVPWKCVNLRNDIDFIMGLYPEYQLGRSNLLDFWNIMC